MSTLGLIDVYRQARLGEGVNLLVVVDQFEELFRYRKPDELDIRESLAELFDEVRPDTCFHLAAQADVGTSVARPLYDAEVNILGTLHVLEAARPWSAQVILTSSGGALYGECDRPAREDDPLSPLSPYGTSKLGAEEYVETWNRLHGEQHVRLRLGNVYGPRQQPKLEGGVVSIFMRRLETGEPIEIFGDGEQTRDFVYVADVVSALLAAAGRPGGVYNVGSGLSTSVNDLLSRCCRVAGILAKPDHAPARAGDLRHSVLDPGRAETELGSRREFDLESGLRATWAWASSS